MESKDGISEGIPTHGGKYTLFYVYGIAFEIPTKYKAPITLLGRGAMGLVCSATNSETGETVAIKKIIDPFQNEVDAQRTLREIILLRHLRHPEVICMKDLLYPSSPSNFNDVYIAYELMPMDLKQVIKLRALNHKHHKMIMYRLLRGLKYIHSANVLHRDLKPENILVDTKCHVRITDFGLARMQAGPEGEMTEYVVTRWYRAPELLLFCNAYSPAIDVWSLGCIYVEMVTGDVLLPGKNYMDQLVKTCQLTGSPGKEDLEFVADEQHRTSMLSLPRWPAKQMGTLIPDPLAADLTQRMLMFDPSKRITVEDALAHPYLADYHDPSDEPVHSQPLEDISFEGPEFTKERLRELVLVQIEDFNRKH